MTALGIDRICEFSHWFQGKKIGLITNYSGVNSSLEEDLEVFTNAAFSVERLFTPEHGLYGTADGIKVQNSIHPQFHIPVISLYGEKIKPNAEDFAGLDLLVYDIQDVGLRYYTFIYTLANCMMTAAECGSDIPFIVLDRPNPLGCTVGGNRMDPAFNSFVGDHALALRYGLTAGELGYYFKSYLHLDLDYRVIPMDGYRKDMLWPDTGQLWNLPSPSIHTFQSILCYYGGCFFEATNISEGRGTAAPFQIYGAPFIDMERFVKELSARIRTDNLAFRKRAFIPLSSKYKGELCFGVEFLPLNEQLDFLSAALITLKTISDLYPEQFAYHTESGVTRLPRLVGDTLVDQYLEGHILLENLLECWENQATSFAMETKEFRIYQ